MDKLKNPCADCDHRRKDKKKEEPCASCSFPAQYNDALNAIMFPTMNFLRNSKPDNWGAKKPKNYKEDVYEQQKSTKGDEPMSNHAQKEKKPVNEMLEKYCEAEGVTVKQVLSRSRKSELAEARRNIARVMHFDDGLNYKTIAVRLKMSPSAVWSYLNAGLDSFAKNNLAEKVLFDLPDTYEKLAKIAKEQERTPILQMRFILKDYCDKESVCLNQKSLKA